MVIKILAIDPSFTNTGWCFASWNSETKSLEIHRGGLITTEKASVKTIRRSSDDLRRAKEIARALDDLLSVLDADMVFAEIPTGTQSARASWALGIAMGCLAGVAVKTHMIEVTPTMTKLASIGRKDATKEEIIAWAFNKYPHLPWIKGRNGISPRNEHMADSVGVLHAGFEHEEFRDSMALFAKMKG